MRQILNECYEGFIEPLQKKDKVCYIDCGAKNF